MPSKIQRQQIKTEAELITDGTTAAAGMPSDSQIFVQANSIDKTLFSAIQDGDIGGGGGTVEIMYINTEIPTGGYYNGIASTTSYKTRNLHSVNTSGDTYGSLDTVNNRLTLPVGTHAINIPVGCINATGAIDFLLYNFTDSVNECEEIVVVSNGGTAVTIFNQVYFTITVTGSSKAFEFRTKAALATGVEFIGRIKVQKLT